MSDIVERLRGKWEWPPSDTMEEAAAEIERLRAALVPFAVAADGFDTMKIKNPEEWFAYGGITDNAGSKGQITVGDLRRARAALQPTQEPRT